jgi:hypothetical protein
MSATTANTRFIQFGRKYKAFAKAVAPRKTLIFALQMSNKHSIIVSNISVDKVSNSKLK